MHSLKASGPDRRSYRMKILALSAGFGFAASFLASLVVELASQSSSSTFPPEHRLFSWIVNFTLAEAIPGFLVFSGILAFLNQKVRGKISPLATSGAGFAVQSATGYCGYVYLTWCHCGSAFISHGGDILVGIWEFFIPGAIAAILVRLVLERSVSQSS